MKKPLFTTCITATLLLLFNINGIFAQSLSYQEKRAQRLQKILKLTDEQTAKITDIYKEEVSRLDSAKKAGDKKAMRPIAKQTDEKVEALLDDKQKKDYINIMATISRY